MDAQRQVTQPHQVGDVAPRFADDPAERLLRVAMLVDQPAIGFAFLERVELFTLDILDNGDFKRRDVIKVFNDYRDLMEVRALRGTPPAFARDDLVVPVMCGIADDDRLKHAARLDRGGQFVERAFIKGLARLVR